MSTRHNGRRHFPSPASPPRDTQITASYGHNGSQVVVVFSQPIRNLQMTEEQARAHVREVEASLDKLKAHNTPPEGAA